nr:transcriptional regulator [Neobacillus sp. YIM B06451]
MTQKELAEGICSIPHLSKIEHTSKEGNRETVALLLQRLGIEIEDVASKDEEIKALLDEFDNQMTFQIKAEADRVFSRLSELGNLIPFSSHIYTYELYKYRYLLFKGDDREAEAQQELLKKHLKNFSRQERNLFDYFTSIHLMRHAKYHKADAILEKLDAEQAGGINLGEFLYHRAFAKGYTLQFGYAIHFGKKALQHFMEQHNFRRILHTLMIMGINYIYSNIFEEASACFEHVIRNAELLNEKGLLPQIYHNMGILQKKTQKLDQAVHYFKKSLSIQKDKGFYYLVTLNSLGETLYLKGEHANSRKCFEEVLRLADQLGNSKYMMVSSFYLMLFDSDPRAYEYLETKVIPLLEDGKELKDDLSYFYKLLADHFASDGKFEQAVHYLNKMI